MYIPYINAKENNNTKAPSSSSIDEGLEAEGFPADCGIGGKADDDDSVIEDLEDSGWFILEVPI